MTAKKSTVETTVYTTFTVPLSELLDAYIPKEEREKPLCIWWVNSDGGKEQMVQIVRAERAAIGFDEQGRERLERDETE